MSYVSVPRHPGAPDPPKDGDGPSPLDRGGGGAPAQDPAAATVVDCRGQVCPKPVFMVKGALAGAQVGQVLEVIVDEDSSKENVLKYCWNHGQEIFRSYGRGPDFHLLVRKSTDKRPDRPLPAVGPCGTRWE